MDRGIVDAYEKGGERLRRAIAGLNSDDLPRVPPADSRVGRWSIHEVVIHLMDVELIAADRMKRIIAEPNPLLIGFDENKFFQGLFYGDQSLDMAVTLIDFSRLNLSRVLRKLPNAAFERTGIHTELGKVTLAEQIGRYDAHMNHHLRFIHDKRALFGKPLTGQQH